MEGGMPIQEAFRKRRSTKEFNGSELSLAEISDILWSMYGMNRSDGRRTAPTVKNWQTTTLYVILPDATYIYNPTEHELQLILSEDARDIAGTQEYTHSAYLNIMLIANLILMTSLDGEDKHQAAACEAGFIAQNAYLHCASAGLKCVSRLKIDRQSINKKFNLSDNMYATLGVTIGK
jgi:nitroreductase